MTTRVIESPAPVCPSTPHERDGVKLPRWFVAGAKVRVKSTPDLRRWGVSVHVPSWGNSADNCAWPKEVGTVRRRVHAGVRSWYVEFERGRERSIRGAEDLKAFARVKEEPDV